MNHVTDRLHFIRTSQLEAMVEAGALDLRKALLSAIWQTTSVVGASVVEASPEDRLCGFTLPGFSASSTNVTLQSAVAFGLVAYRWADDDGCCGEPRLRESDARQGGEGRLEWMRQG